MMAFVWWVVFANFPILISADSNILRSNIKSADRGEEPLSFILSKENNLSAYEKVVKLLEDYTVAADFNHRPTAQIPVHNNHIDAIANTAVHPETSSEPVSRVFSDEGPQSAALSEVLTAPPYRRVTSDFEIYSPSGYLSTYQHAADRGAVIPWGVGSSTVLVSQPSLFVVGFITFLILLSSLHQNLLTLALFKRPATSTSLLDSVTQAVGRRRRSAWYTQMLS